MISHRIRNPLGPDLTRRFRALNKAIREELAAKRAAELADLKGVSLSLLTEAKRRSTACDHEF